MNADSRTISSYFEEDHDRLDALLTSFHELKRSEFERARESFREFKFGLQRHIVWEEELLFPLWERRAGRADCGPTVVMREEHRRIGKALEALHQKVRQGDPECDAEEQELLRLLSDHNVKEERVLYPSIDNQLSEEDRQALFAQMNALPEERYHSCCGTHE
jgi:iron-sulfur cluster repair protein YtfE (RIC family)